MTALTKIVVSGARGPRGNASGPLGAGSVDAATITNDSTEQNAIVNKLGLTSSAAGKGASLIYTEQGYTLQDLTNRFYANRMISLFYFMTPAEIADVSDGTPTLDIAPKMQALINFCDFYQYTAWIPEVFALLGSRIEQRPRVRVMSDANGTLKWTNPADCGWFVFGDDSGQRPGYCSAQLPQMIGPNDITGYEDGSKIYSVAAFSGIGLHVQDCIWSDFKVQQMKGWGTAVRMTNTVVPTDNNYFELGTIDLCKYGVRVESPATATKAVGQSRFRTMNIFALCPIYIKAPAGAPGVFECDFDFLGITNAEVGGTCIYLEGPNISDCVFTGKARNGYLPNDSPVGTPTDMRGPIVGGDGVAGAEPGWAIGTRNTFKLRLEEFEPAAGDSIAIKVRGPGSHVGIETPSVATANPFASIALSATQGEANYNGGLGAASVHGMVRVNFTIAALASGASQTFYFYHQRLNPDNIAPLEIVQIDNPNDLQIYTANNGPTVPREGQVIVRNATANPTSTTVNLWLRVP